MAKLKPCPFCGGEAETRTEVLGTWKVRCTKCSAEVGRYWFWSKNYAIEAWNKRSNNNG
jgi:Lar family restriction alleviation protein